MTLVGEIVGRLISRLYHSFLTQVYFSSLWLCTPATLPLAKYISGLTLTTTSVYCSTASAAAGTGMSGSLRLSEFAAWWAALPQSNFGVISSAEAGADSCPDSPDTGGLWPGLADLWPG